ncbi:hypothetical protein PG987_014484 [Apiospora arundinis]
MGIITRAVAALPFLLIAVWCFREMALDQLDASARPSAESGFIEWGHGKNKVAILDHFHGVPFLDQLWRGGTAVFAVSAFGMDGVAAWQVFTFLVDLGPLYAIWILESHRGGQRLVACIHSYGVYPRRPSPGCRRNHVRLLLPVPRLQPVGLGAGLENPAAPPHRLVPGQRPPAPARAGPAHGRGLRHVPVPELRGAPLLGLGLAADAAVDRRRQRRSRTSPPQTAATIGQPEDRAAAAAVHFCCVDSIESAARRPGFGVRRGLALHRPVRPAPARGPLCAGAGAAGRAHPAQPEVAAGGRGRGLRR